jgi:hypothetical protein
MFLSFGRINYFHKGGKKVRTDETVCVLCIMFWVACGMFYATVTF